MSIKPISSATSSSCLRSYYEIQTVSPKTFEHFTQLFKVYV